MKPPRREEAGEELTFPLDLSLWTPTARLREWIMDDVATLDWTNAEVMELLRRRPDFEPKALLNTITLAYATGIFTADEIARRCSVDVEFRAVRPKLPPSMGEIKTFRKENHGLLKWSLAKVITRALRVQLIEGESIETLPAGLRRAILENAIERLEIARHLDRKGEL